MSNMLPVSIRLIVVNGTPEARDLRKWGNVPSAARRWAVHPAANERPAGNAVPMPLVTATEGCTVDLSLVPGRYVLVSGFATRLPFSVTVPATITIDPVSRSVVADVPPPLAPVAAPAPVAPIVTVETAYVWGVPALAGITFDSPADAREAVTAAIAAGITTREAFRPVGGEPPTAGLKYGTAPARTAAPLVRTAAPVAIAEVAPDSGASAFVATYSADQDHDRAAAAERTRVQLDHLARFGLVFPPPVVEPGSALVQWGRDALAHKHAEWASKPRTIDGLSGVISAVRSERRIDIPAGMLRDVTMDDSGRLVVTGWDHPIAMEGDGLRSLLSDLSDAMPGSFRLMETLTPATRARVWNERTPETASTAVRVLRTRQPSDDFPRAAFATVSPGYTALDADQIAGIARDALISLPGGSEARGEVRYSPSGAALRIAATFAANNVENFTQDVFRFGAVIGSSDDGGGAIYVRLFGERNRCVNLIITAESTATTARIVHRGDRRTMVARLRAGIAHVMEAGEPLLRQWGYLAQRKIDSLILPAHQSADPKVNARAVLAEIAGARKRDRKTGDYTDDLPALIANAIPKGAQLDSASVERDVIVEMMLRQYAIEDDAQGTLASVVNAVTALHREPVPVALLRSAESAGGILADAWGTAG